MKTHPLILNKLLLSLALLFACLASSSFAQDDSPQTRLFDTGAPAAVALDGTALGQVAGWRLIPEDTVKHDFAGDAVFMNDKLAVVLRRQGRGAEVYAKTAGGFKARATISALDANPQSESRPPQGRPTIAENGSGAVMIEVGAVGYRLTTGEGTLEIRGGAGAVRVESAMQYAVVPDFFGDDVVFGAEAFSGRALPAENMCLGLLEGGEAIMMGVWQSSRQEAWLEAGRALRIGCLSGKSIWLAFIEGGAGLWRAAAEGEKFQAPFPAKWRCSAVRAGGGADSWDAERGPAPEQAAAKRTGPALIYPIDRSAATPLMAVCPTDVMRNTLGVGPCQYILAVEGMAADGDPTPNNVMNWVEKQFDEKKESRVADEIKERLDVMSRHVAEAAGRIKVYGAQAEKARALLAGAAGAEAWRAIVEDWRRFAEAGLALEAAPSRAAELAAAVIALEGKADGAAGCHEAGARLRAIGATQDRALARCRMAIRRLKQEGRSLAGSAPQGGGAVQEVLRLAEEMLQVKSEVQGEAK